MDNSIDKFKNFILKGINRVIPKKKNQILFASVPDFSDNANPLFDFIIKNNILPDFRIIWLVSDKKNIEIFRNLECQIFYEKSIAGLYNIFRSKYIITTHLHYCLFKTRNQILINLWHGMPLKAMGYIDKSEDENSLKKFKKCTNSTDLMIATSLLMKNALVSCFYLDPRKVIITGQPRNDKLFFAKSQANLADIVPNSSVYDKIVFFIPTFRLWEDRIEGDPFYNKLFSSEELHSYLKKNKILFILKLHPFEEEKILSHYSFSDNPNFMLLTNSKLQEKQYDIYDILGSIDILITDYSSIYFDYLLINRPILFMPVDLEEYSKKRGFVLEPYEFWTPGPKVTTIEKLVEELNIFIQNPDYYIEERKLINSLVNTYNDDHSCERVWESIRGRLLD